MAEGFNERSIGFLIELRARNDRKWYKEHKEEYNQHVVKPFQALAAALTPTILKIDPLIETTPAVGKTISRVHRDARFTNDKSLYRDRAWLTFVQKIKENAYVPAFYFEIMPTGYRYGVGFYNVSAKIMDEYRAMIDCDEKAFLDIIAPVTNSDEFTVEGDMYKRDHYTGPHPEVAGWYNRKNIYIAANRADLSETYNFDALASRLDSGFSALSGIYYFWREAAFR